MLIRFQAPALEISKTYHKVRFDGSLRRGSSPYKGPPSPQVDAAWARIIEGIVHVFLFAFLG